MSEPYLGQIIMFGGNFAINGWAMCNGQLMSISSNTALFSILGTTFGGDGIRTFALPDLRGRVPVHQGQGAGLSNYDIGEQTGSENVTILYNQMPLHSHTANALSTTAGAVATASGNVPCTVLTAVSGPGTLPHVAVSAYSPNTPDIQMSNKMIGTAGGNVPTPILQPLLCVTFLIALVGIFPSRN